jgi:hypothetical protein
LLQRAEIGGNTEMVRNDSKLFRVDVLIGSRPWTTQANGEHRMSFSVAPREMLRLAEDGFVVVNDAGFTDGAEVDEAAVVRIAEAFGKPSTRDGGRAVWPIRPVSDRTDATFSLRAGAARLHTDAAYRDAPEDLVVMFCVRPAADGGATELLHGRHAAAGLDVATTEALRRTQWFWRPPAVFGGAVAGPYAVLSESGMRWRWDNLDLPARLTPTAASFRDHVDGHPATIVHRMVTDQVLVFDNTQMLHGRTAFSDPRRLLLRVRLWRRNSAAGGAR